MVYGTTGLGTTANPVPLDYNALRAAPDLVIEQYVADNLFFRTKNRYPFVSFLEMVSRQGQQNYTVDGKKINWFVGDEEPTTAVLGATYTFPAATVTLAADYGSFVIGTILNLREAIGNVPYLCQLRITSAPTAVGALWRYDVEPIRAYRADTYVAMAATAFTTAGCGVYVLSHMAPWDGEAGEYIQRRPVSIWNIMQRSRECVGEGKWQMSESFYTDIRIMRQAQDKMYNMLTKLDKQMLLNPFRVTPSNYTAGGTGYTNSLEGANFAGIPYYLQPGRYNGGAGPSAADVTSGAAPLLGLRGQIHGVAAAALTYDKLNYFGDKITQFGGDLKICVASPANIMRVKAALNGVTGLRTYTEKFVFPGTSSIWEMDAVQLDAVRIAFMPDHNLDNVSLYCNGTDPETDANVASGNTDALQRKWAYFIDPKHIGAAHLNVAGEGTSTIKMFDVSPNNRSSIVRKEIEVGMSLVVPEVRSHGVLFLNA